VLKDISSDTTVIDKKSDSVPITAVNGTITFIKKTRVSGFQLHLSGNPTTNEDFLITKDDIDDPVYNAIIYKEDLSIPASDPITDVVKPYYSLTAEAGEKWVITWPNSETLTYGFKIFGTEID